MGLPFEPHLDKPLNKLTTKGIPVLSLPAHTFTIDSFLLASTT
jgi:hypothetical protein